MELKESLYQWEQGGLHPSEIDDLIRTLLSENKTIKAKQQEIDQLKAQVKNLKFVLKETARHLPAGDEMYGLKWGISDVLQETQDQSLTNHDSKLLEGLKVRPQEDGSLIAYSELERKWLILRSATDSHKGEVK